MNKFVGARPYVDHSCRATLGACANGGSPPTQRKMMANPISAASHPYIRTTGNLRNLNRTN